jgi:predicted transcriptional regulator
MFLAEMPLREGAPAIYIERPLIAYVRVSEIRGFEDHMEALVTVVPTPGMNEDCSSQFKIRAAWDWLSNTHDMWHVHYVAFSVYFGEEAVRIGLELAARAAERGFPVTLSEMRTALEESRRKYWDRPPS